MQIISTVIWYKESLSNTNDFETDQCNPYIGPLQILPLQVRVDMGVMARSNTNSPELQNSNLITKCQGYAYIKGSYPLCN